jgi:uncharacterized protein (TIGR03437 family)
MLSKENFAAAFRLRSISQSMILGLLLTSFSLAQSASQWRQLTPIEGGIVASLLSAGGKVYAGTSNRGIFVSTDNGATWRESSKGLGNSLIVSHLVAVDEINLGLAPAANQIILAGTNAGLYRSKDGGQSWTPVVVGNLPPSPLNAVRALAADNTAIFAGLSDGHIFFSTDSGLTWGERARLPDNQAISALAVKDGQPVAGALNGVFRSTNQGQSWQSVTNGLPGNGQLTVLSLAINGSRIYLGTRADKVGTSHLPQVYVSNDDGQNWQAVGKVLTAQIDGSTFYRQVIAFGFDGANVFAGTETGIAVFKGQDWEEAASNRGLPSLPVITAITNSAGKLLISSFGAGVYSQANDGQRWNTQNAGLTAAAINALAVSGENIFASSALAGVFRSADNGQSWMALPGAVNAEGRPLSVTHLAARGGKVFAATNLYGMFSSADNGASWKQLNDGLRANSGIQDLIAADGEVYALNFGFVYKLNAEGNRWIQLNQEELLFAYAIAASGANIYVALSQNAVMRSTNGGASFTTINTGAMGISAIAARGNNVYIADASSFSPGIFVSTNNGESFMASQSSLQANGFAFSGGTIYARTEFSGVYFSINNGLNWTPINAGLANRVVSALAVKGETLLAGTIGHSVYAALNPQLQLKTLAAVSAASFRANAELARVSIATAFGSELATTTETATGPALAPQLAGTRVLVRDSTGAEFNAGIFFVSPGQVSFLVPPVANGNATIIIASGDGSTSVGNVVIADVAPGLFAANATGQGAAAAVALRVKADGSQQYEPVVQFDSASGRFVTRPLDLGPDGEQVFLVLYGTGIRFRSSLTGVTARIGGENAPVSYAGSQTDFLGLDQCNVLIPRTLAGRGEVEVALTVDGKIANAVSVRIK